MKNVELRWKFKKMIFKSPKLLYSQKDHYCNIMALLSIYNNFY